MHIDRSFQFPKTYLWANHKVLILNTIVSTAQCASPTDQLRLALTWNRADIARAEIFTKDQKWEVLMHSYIYCWLSG